MEQKVQMWEEMVTIPTYKAGEPDKNPMFLEKRVYQGSSGKVYPHSVIDKIYDEKEDKTYKAVYLENDYLKVMILPELGGRIQRAYDKTNHYDFVYYNHVIKPALVGLAGPWISGGIEFNWPQHHRPSTFDEVDYQLERHEDGSATVWVGEIENMFRTKGMAGFTLYPHKAYIEIKARIYNRTSTPQTFLWWANPAVAVNDNTRSVFPPDVHAVMDHGKRDVSNFPIATGTYYKMDYSSGVDISRYKNIPVPTSYMAYHSDYDFVGGYDYGVEAGILHVADHHVAPGKKQWTWGCGEFGKAWDRNLTDEDGPYIELMTGCFTDNQPDFTWLMPYEEKTFTQYFMPYKGVGNVLNAQKDICAGLEISREKGDGENTAIMKAGVYASTVLENVTITIQEKDGDIMSSEKTSLTPLECYKKEFIVEADAEEYEYEIIVTDQSGCSLLTVSQEKPIVKEIPEAAKAMPLPQDVKTNDDLFLYGLHLEQYRHATYEPSDYYLEGLKRDPGDWKLNTAYGKLLFARGQFAQALPYFEKAVSKLLRSNPNPYDGEPLYYMGLALKYLGKHKKSCDAFQKAVWNGAWQDSGYYQIACMDCVRKDYGQALEHIEKSLVRNWHNMKARDLKAAVLRKLGKFSQAADWIRQTRSIDPLDHNSMNELLFLAEEGAEVDFSKNELRNELKKTLHHNHNTYIELAQDYIEAGMWKEAGAVLNMYLEECDPASAYPMVFYYLAFIIKKTGCLEKAAEYVQAGQNASSDYCFPHRLDDILVLEEAKGILPSGDKAYYYLGNLWYDKKQYELAIHNWECAQERNDSFPTVHRNLALAYFNKTGDREKALAQLEKAFELNQEDSRVLMELDQLTKKLGRNADERLARMEENLGAVENRDDLYLEYLTLLNSKGEYTKVISLIQNRNFHPWEGGEGKVPAQYILCHLEEAKKALEGGDYTRAEELIGRITGEYPHNLGEGKLYGARENHIYYYLGLIKEKMGKTKEAEECFHKAAEGIMEPAGMMYYNDQPPEMIYYQGEALKKLGKRKEALGKFNQLIDYGKKHLFDQVRIDYFAVSLPDLQIFEEDLDEKNKAHCYFMMALGYLGKGEESMASQCFSQVKKSAPFHNGAGVL